MQLAMIGLGRMGLNMAARLIQGGHSVVGFDRFPQARAKAAQAGAQTAASLRQAVLRLKAPRIVWLMLPAGKPVFETIKDLTKILHAGDIIIDGGNSHYKDAAIHAKTLRRKKIRFLDMGVSGGIWGLDNGYCLMAGGAASDFKKLEPILACLAAKDAYSLLGPIGAGHFAKMVHNGIEYGMMQSYAEGFELARSSPFNLDLENLCRLWNQGSVIRSWLLELAQDAFKKDPQLKSLRGYVEDSGEARWAVLDAVEKAVPLPVITQALFERFRSRIKDSFEDKVLAALRNEFGGHAVIKSK